MKRKVFVTMLLGMMLCACPVSLAAASNEEVTEESYVPVTSGYVFDEVSRINPNFELSESQKDLNITYDTTKDYTSSDVQRFFLDSCRILDIEQLGEYYDSFSFALLGDKVIEQFSVTEYQDIYDFKTTYVGPISTDEDVKEYFPLFYYAAFGSKDIAASLSKTMHSFDPSKYELPSTYQAGYLWTFSNFGDVITHYAVDKTSIDVEIKSQNTVDCGKNAWEKVERALDSFDMFRNKDGDSMPYTKISVHYIDSTSEESLWDLVIEKQGGTWKATENQANGDFLQGLGK